MLGFALGVAPNMLAGSGLNPRYQGPAGVPALPMQLLGASGSTPVCAPNDAITAALTWDFPIVNSGSYYVKPSTGSDSNPGTFLLPFATVAKAMRTATGAASHVLMLEDATIPSFDLRNTDASQTAQQFKWLDANGFNVTVRDTGPDLTVQTWTQDATFTNCYTSTLAVSGSQQPTRVQRTDITDSYIFNSTNILSGKNCYQQFKPYASATLLNAATGDGYFWDNTGKVLWIKIGAGTNVQSQRSILRALYSNSAGTSRILVIGASVGFSGVRFEGVQFVQLDGASRRPEHWLHNCTILWPLDKGADLTQTGVFAITDSLMYSSKKDGINAFAASATGKGLIQGVRTTILRAGDQSQFAADGTLQGISAHGGSNHVSWGVNALECNAPGFGDTCVNSSTDITWLFNCTSKGYPGGVSVANFQGGSTATAGTRALYLDGVTSTSPTSGVDVQIDVNATFYQFGSSLTSNGTIQPYTPG